MPAPATFEVARFDPAMVDDLPEAAARWLRRSVRPGAPLARRGVFGTHGEIRIAGRWRRFTAHQVVEPARGFHWAARTRIGPLPARCIDAYVDGVGSLRWRVGGLPVRTAAGGDASLSALGRLAADAILVPTSLVHDAWYPAGSADAAMYAHRIEGRYMRPHVVITAGPQGRLLGLRMHRWGPVGGGRYEPHPFAVRFDGEFDTGPLLLPDRFTASWPHAGGEFFRARLDHVELE